MAAVFKAMRTDFGAQFIAAVPSEKDANAWKWRLYRKLDVVAPDVAIDGYERAVQERRPYMPNLVDLVDAIRQVQGERQRAKDQIARIPMPKHKGLDGYVDTVLAPNGKSQVASECLAIMRAIRGRPTAPPEEVAARRAKALEVHRELLAKAPPIRHRGDVQTCAVEGCGQRGSHTHAVNGKNPVWLCVKHWREG